jgi:hypothetical protein
LRAWEPANNVLTFVKVFLLAKELTLRDLLAPDVPPSETNSSESRPALSDAFLKSPYAIPHATSFISQTPGQLDDPRFILCPAWLAIWLKTLV